MSEDSTTGPEVTETVDQKTDEFPADHPLVKTLAAQKSEIKELKARTRRLDEIEEAQKSEAEKAADRIAKAEAEVASVPAKVAEALKAHLIALHEIDGDDAELFLTATDPEVLLKQVTRLLDRSDKRRNKNTVTREGTNPTATPSEDAAFARNFLGPNG